MSGMSGLLGNLMIQHVPVEIIGDHPHAGTKGYIIATGGNVKVADVWGSKMFLVDLIDSPLLVAACYAERHHLKILGPPETR